VANLAQRAGLQVLDGVLPVVAAALPHADLHDAPGLLDGPPHRVALGDRVAERLLDVDVLAGLAGVDQLPAVPVVGGADDDEIEVVVLQQAAVVVVEVRRRAGLLLELAGPLLEHVAVDVAERRALHTVDLLVGAHVGPAHAVDADDAEAQLIARRHRRLGADGRGGKRGEPGPRHGGGSGSEKFATAVVTHGEAKEFVVECAR